MSVWILEVVVFVDRVGGVAVVVRIQDDLAGIRSVMRELSCSTCVEDGSIL